MMMRNVTALAVVMAAMVLLVPEQAEAGRRQHRGRSRCNQPVRYSHGHDSCCHQPVNYQSVNYYQPMNCCEPVSYYEPMSTDYQAPWVSTADYAEPNYPTSCCDNGFTTASGTGPYYYASFRQ